jgi:hypothetical protein
LTLPRTGQFWLFHSLWHVVHAGAVFLACSCRVPRKNDKSGSRPQSKHNRRVVQRRWWLSVLLRNIFPSSMPHRQAANRQLAPGAATATKKEK